MEYDAYMPWVGGWVNGWMDVDDRCLHALERTRENRNGCEKGLGYFAFPAALRTAAARLHTDMR